MTETPRNGPEVADCGDERFGLGEWTGLWARRRRLMVGTVTALAALCVLYCLLVPNQYDATATVTMRMQPVPGLGSEAAEGLVQASILSSPLQLETLANELRSEHVAWRVIRTLRLDQKPAFSWRFPRKFPDFDADHPTIEQQSYLLKAFAGRLQVRALAHSLLLEVRFRSKDPRLSAEVANAVVKVFMADESAQRMGATAQATGYLQAQLTGLTQAAEEDQRVLVAFEEKHGLLPLAGASNAHPTEGGGQDPAMLQLDDLSRQLAAASGDRIAREAVYDEAKHGDPEQVLAANPGLAMEMGQAGGGEAQALRAKLSDEAVEMAQWRTEHGPNFPRVVELNRAMEDEQRQLTAVDARLVEGFRRLWQASKARESMLRRELETETRVQLKQNNATVEHAVLEARAVAARELCARVEVRIAEASLAAGARPSQLSVVDQARPPFRAAAPDLPVYLAITVFVGCWLALGLGLMADAWDRSRAAVRAVAVIVLVIVLAAGGHAQAPLPSTQGLPSGVVKTVKDAPAQRPPEPTAAALPPTGAVMMDAAPPVVGVPLPLPLEPGDLVLVSEFHTPEFRTDGRVDESGALTLPMVGAVKVIGLSETAAARAIEKALLDGGFLVHPQVTVMVTGAVGEDVSVLGEVARPGVYPYTAHHRLLDLIAAAQGLTQTAGRLVELYHRDDPNTAHPVVLEAVAGASSAASVANAVAEGTEAANGGASPAAANGATKDQSASANPELEPGDTVKVSRAGLVYVIGDVVRPGGFAVDPVQGLTVVQALSLAWGATPSAAETKAILIRDQKGGRTLTTLNLKRMIRGQEPDEPVHDRDILFVPDSQAKDLWNKTIESAIQSAIGITIYAGLVYSQRF